MIQRFGIKIASKYQSVTDTENLEVEIWGL